MMIWNIYKQTMYQTAKSNNTMFGAIMEDWIMSNKLPR